jgi:1,2-diacylglycerol 3-alpha-glucosyltransferase
VLLHRGYARRRVERACAQVTPVAGQQSIDRIRASLRVEAAIRLPAGEVCALGRASGVGHDHGQSAGDGFRHTEPERLVWTPVHQDVGARERAREVRTVPLESDKADARGRASLESRSLRSVAEKYQHRLASCADASERLEHDVPALLEREAAHADEQHCAIAGASQEFEASPFAPGPGPERRDVYAHRRMDHASDPRRAQSRSLCAPRDERRGERGQHHPHPLPEWDAQRGRRRLARVPDERGLDVRADVVRMPERRSHPRQCLAAADHGSSRQVRRVRLQDVGLLRTNAPSDLVQSGEQVIRAVVREGGPRDAHHARARVVPCDVRAVHGIFIARARRNHEMVVTELAQKVTSGGQMASNPSAPFGIEFGDVDDLHSLSPALTPGAANGATRFSAAANSGLAGEHGPHLRPFAALTARQGRPLRVAILSDFTRISYANGAVFQTRFLYQELRRCGHEVTVIGPHDPDATPDELPPGTVALPSVPLKTYPGVHIPMPLAPWIFDPDRWDFDVCFAQTTSLLLEFGIWLREMKGVPLLCVNTTHLIAAYEVLLPERLSKNDLLQAGVHLTLKRPFEKLFSSIYNQSDGLVVLSEGLRTYWRERGVTAPIHVIPRAVQPDVFDRPIGPDPYTHLLEREGLPQRGPRLLCAGRLTREKSQGRVISIFAKHVLPHEPDATLTVVGEGPEMAHYRRLARDAGAEHRVFFTGEVPWTTMPDFYRYADVFVHASLSETYGNVLGEALWCGTPTVAFADGMGVSAQVQDGVSGVLFAPGKGDETEAAADAAFGRAAVELIRDPRARARLGKAAARRSRERCSPLAVEQRIADAFQHAQDHALACGLRPVEQRPKVMQWLTTLRHARPWTTFNGLIYLGGHLRPAKGVKRERMHPSIA